MYGIDEQDFKLYFERVHNSYHVLKAKQQLEEIESVRKERKEIEPSNEKLFPSYRHQECKQACSRCGFDDHR
jgi:hypothetical protein